MKKLLIIAAMGLALTSQAFANSPCSKSKGGVASCNGTKFVCNDGSTSKSTKVCNADSLKKLQASEAKKTAKKSKKVEQTNSKENTSPIDDATKAKDAEVRKAKKEERAKAKAEKKAKKAQAKKDAAAKKPVTKTPPKADTVTH